MRAILIAIMLTTPCHAGYRESHAETMRLLRMRTELLLDIQWHQESIIRMLETQLERRRHGK